MKVISHIIRVLFLALFVFLLISGKGMLWFGLFALSLIAALLFGRVYCGYVCPMNTVMRPIAWLSDKLGLQTKNTPRWLKNGMLPWIALLVSAAAMLLSKRLLHIFLPVLPFWLVISVLVTIRYRPAVFHNLICPFGALQKLFGKGSFLSEKVDKTACIGCGLCENVCPSEAILVSKAEKKANINRALCHQCESCREVCPRDANSYGKRS
jgi:polyferredoxin